MKLRMKKVFIFLVCVVTVSAFAGAGICLDADQARQETKKMSVMERIKKAYSDFKNRGDKKETVKETAEEVAAAAPRPADMIEEPASVGQETVAPSSRKAMTKEELLVDLKDDLEGADEIFKIVPELKLEKNKDGTSFYTYKGVKLDDMAKEDLEGLSAMIGQHLSRIRVERIERQLETVRRTQEMNRLAAPTKPPVPPSSLQSPPVIPQSSGVVSAPRPVSPPPSVQKAPPSPPLTPPSTRR